jgi:S-adenosylmethionine decarboxylase
MLDRPRIRAAGDTMRAEGRVEMREEAISRLQTAGDGQDTVAAPHAAYLLERDGAWYAGSHLLIDLWEAEHLDDIDYIDAALRAAVAASGATLLRVDLHHFHDNGGVSGVAILAESHLSIHTWPELGYAAVDAFMCGSCDPRLTLPVLEERFAPSRMEVTERLRGRQR